MKHELTDLDHLNIKTAVDWSKSTLFPACPLLPCKYDKCVNTVDKAVSGAIMNMSKIPEGWTPEDYGNIIFCGIFSELWGVIQMNYKGRGYIVFKGEFRQLVLHFYYSYSNLPCFTLVFRC